MTDPLLPELTGEPYDDPPAVPPHGAAPFRVRFAFWIYEIERRERGPRDIFAWWEKRRLAYNAIVGACGLATLAVYMACAPGFLPRASFPDLALEGVVAALLIGIAANFCYFLGPILEVCIKRFVVRNRRHRIAPILLKTALGISLFAVLIPGLLMLLAYAIIRP